MELYDTLWNFMTLYDIIFTKKLIFDRDFAIFMTLYDLYGTLCHKLYDGDQKFIYTLDNLFLSSEKKNNIPLATPSWKRLCGSSFFQYIFIYGEEIERE